LPTRVGNPGPGFLTSFQLLRQVGCGLNWKQSYWSQSKLVNVCWIIPTSAGNFYIWQKCHDPNTDAI